MIKRSIIGIALIFYIAATANAQSSFQIVSIRAFGAVGNGTTDDSSAINSAIQVASQSNYLVIVDGGFTYGIGAPLNGSFKNVHFLCPTGNAKFKKLASGGTTSILTVDTGNYEGWTFDGIEFDGNVDAMGTLPGISMNLSNARNLTFRNCKFRGLNFPVAGAGSSNFKFIDCKFYGTRSGVMASGVMNPSAVATAIYTSGAQFNGACQDIEFVRCYFHFCVSGVTAASNLTEQIQGFYIRDSQFRGDWWNTPFVTKRFTPTAYDNTSRILTVTGGLSGFFLNNEIVSVPVIIGTTNTNFSGIFAGKVTATGKFSSARVGDVIETSNGKRAEIISKIDNDNVDVRPWESIDTFEDVDPPSATGFDWQLVRYYASGTAPLNTNIAVAATANTITLANDASTTPNIYTRIKIVAGTGAGQSKVITSYSASRVATVDSNWTTTPNTSSRYEVFGDTQVQLYSEPVNVFTGELLVTGASLSPVGRECRTFAKLIYSGVHVNGGVHDLDITGSRFRGSWADQVSVFESFAPKIIGNTIEYGQDEGITLTGCPRARVSNNTFRFAGVSAVFFGATANQASDYITISDNTVHSWGCVNRVGHGAFDGASLGSVITGNTVTVEPGSTFGGASARMISLWYDNSSAGMVIANNVDGGARTATLDVSASTGLIVARDVQTIVGAGASGVYAVKSGKALFGGTVPATSAKIEARSTDDAFALISGVTLAGHPTFSLFPSGNTFWNAVPSDATTTARNSPGFFLNTTRWNGTSSVTEGIGFFVPRLNSGAGGYAGWFQDNDGLVSLALAGKGGQVVVGYSFPAEGLLPSLGQFHVRSLAATTPTLTAQRLTGQTADIFKAMDESSNTLAAIDANGGVRYRSITFASLPTSANGTIFYCSDCQQVKPCSSGGTGALAKRINGAWECQ